MPTQVNTAGMVLGVPSNEAAMNIESVTEKPKAKFIEVEDNIGNTIDIKDYDHTKDITLTGETIADPSATLVLGGLLPVANLTTFGGANTGSIILKDMELKSQRGKLRTVTYNATQYPLVNRAGAGA